MLSSYYFSTKGFKKVEMPSCSGLSAGSQKQRVEAAALPPCRFGSGSEPLVGRKPRTVKTVPAAGTHAGKRVAPSR